MMSKKAEVELRDLTRVVASGTASYLIVHFLLLPQLVRLGVSFPAYFYIGVIATGALAVGISLLTRPRPDAASEASALHPAE